MLAWFRNHPRMTQGLIGAFVAVMAPSVITSGLHSMAYVPIHAVEGHFATSGVQK